MVAGDVMPHDSVGVEVVQDADAQLRFAVVPQLIPVVRLGMSFAGELVFPSTYKIEF